MSSPPVRDSVGDGFTIAAVGDCMVAQPVSRVRRIAPIRTLLHRADVAVGNLETSLLHRSQIRMAPPAEFGPAWLIGPPSVAKDLKSLGCDLVSRANNHATDFGVEGIAHTSRALAEAGIGYSGIGKNRTRAIAPCYLDTDRGRIALISVASTYAPLSRATRPVGPAPGRPGVNALRTVRCCFVTPNELQMLRNIRDRERSGHGGCDLKEEAADECEVCGVRFKAGDRPGFTYSTEPADVRELIESIFEAKRKANFVIFSIHAHEPGNWSEPPADFMPELAHQVIDAGVDAFIGHGPHRLRGIEIYRGRPVFYSLGNFISNLESMDPAVNDLVEQYKMDLGASDTELRALWAALRVSGDVWYQSVVATTRYEMGRVAEIRLTPIDLGSTRPLSERGIPAPATGAKAQAILEGLQRISEPFGTRISIERGIGVIRAAARMAALR